MFLWSENIWSPLYRDPRNNALIRFSIFGNGGPRARFGSAVSGLGDLDGDGFGDFVVGAPFENDDGGVVR